MKTSYQVAMEYMGLQEVRDKLTLMNLFARYSKNGDLKIDPEATPWCAAFINVCEREIGNPGTGLLNARSFLDYGKPVKKGNEQQGDIVIFNFGEDSYHGHVTYLSQIIDNETWECLGGNQSNKVQKTNYDTQYIIGVVRYS